jgi:hypothetical protein
MSSDKEVNRFDVSKHLPVPDSSSFGVHIVATHHYRQIFGCEVIFICRHGQGTHRPLPYDFPTVAHPGLVDGNGLFFLPLRAISSRRALACDPAATTA